MYKRMFLPKKKNTEIFHIKKRASYFNLEETSGELKHTITMNKIHTAH